MLQCTKLGPASPEMTVPLNTKHLRVSYSKLFVRFPPTRLHISFLLMESQSWNRKSYMPSLFTAPHTASQNEKPSLPCLLLSPQHTPSLCACRCYVDDKVSRVAWLNRSNIIFAGQDKWSLDPRVDLVTKGQLEYSLRIQKVIVGIEP